MRPCPSQDGSSYFSFLTGLTDYRDLEEGEDKGTSVIAISLEDVRAIWSLFSVGWAGGLKRYRCRGFWEVDSRRCGFMKWFSRLLDKRFGQREF